MHSLRRLIRLSYTTFPKWHSKLLPVHMHRIQRSFATKMEERTPREIRIPVPFGHIAGQEWGPKDGIPVLALHGWMDNSGTFEKLVPLLSHQLHVVAIDEPGIGFSSPMPAGAIIHHLDMIYHVRRVLEYFKWDKVALIGHSRGGAVSLLYAALFPKQVSRIIMLDIVRPLVVPTDYLISEGGKRIDSFLKYEKLFTDPNKAYTPEEAMSILVTSHGGSITEESAKILMKRGTKSAPDGEKVIFSRDLRLKAEAIVPIFTLNQLRQHMTNVTCNMLIITASHGIYNMRWKDMEEFLEIYDENCSNFVHKEVNGTHHVHLNEPEKVAPIINAFLNPVINGKL